MNKTIAKTFRKITKRFVISCNLIAVTVFLLASASSFLNPVKYWLIAILGIGFPYLLLIIFCFLFFWLTLKSKWSILNVVVLIIAFTNIKSVFAFHFPPKQFKIEKKDSNQIRVLQWNTMSFGEYEKNRIKGSEIRDNMLEYIKKQDADVLCFQEFFDSYHKEFSQNITYIMHNLGYPNVYFSKDYLRYGITKDSGSRKIGFWGTAIFTRLNLLDTGKVFFNTDPNRTTESLAFVDVLKNNKKIRIFSTHLQSIKLDKSDYEEIDRLKTAKETDITKSIGVFEKIKNAYSSRKQQANLIEKEVQKINYPVILTGDFNDVPNSYTYSTIKGNLQDVFLKKGFGIGRTFNAISPTLRIDYVFASKDFEILQFKKDNYSRSDHYPLVVDLKLK